jgi:hypothetical protein
MNRRVLLIIETEHPCGADANAGAAPMAESAINDLREPSEGARGLVLAIARPFEWLDKTPLLAERGVRGSFSENTQRR